MGKASRLGEPELLQELWLSDYKTNVMPVLYLRIAGTFCILTETAGGDSFVRKVSVLKYVWWQEPLNRSEVGRSLKKHAECQVGHL